MQMVFYGNLPEPLSNEELIRLLTQYKNGDYYVRNIIIEHNIKLVINLVLNKFVNTTYEKDELVSIGLTELIKCLDTFDIDKNVKFSTYAYNCVKNVLLNYIRDNGRRKVDTVSYENQYTEGTPYKDILPSNQDIIEDFETKERDFMIKELLLNLNERDRIFMMLYYGFVDNRRYTYKDIGDMYNVSGSYVAQVIKRNLLIIRERIEKQKKLVRR